jgi:glycerophosphoryl diester phosphodiesterase
VKIFAHRGFSHKFPESTRIAYEEAVKAGADGFECDVRLARNGEIVCFHDWSTRRISGKFGIISFLTLSELRKLVNIITLSELLDIAIEHKKDLLIETKHPIFESFKLEKRVIELLTKRKEEIERAGITVITMSFSYLAVRRLKQSYPKVAKVIKYRFSALRTRERCIAISIKVLRGNPEVLTKLQGRQIFTWTVNSKEDFRWVAQQNLTGVITDEVESARKELRI